MVIEMRVQTNEEQERKRSEEIPWDNRKIGNFLKRKTKPCSYERKIKFKKSLLISDIPSAKLSSNS